MNYWRNMILLSKKEHTLKDKPAYWVAPHAIFLTEHDGAKTIIDRRSLTFDFTMPAISIRIMVGAKSRNTNSSAAAQVLGSGLCYIPKFKLRH